MIEIKIKMDKEVVFTDEVDNLDNVKKLLQLQTPDPKVETLSIGETKLDNGYTVELIEHSDIPPTPEQEVSETPTTTTKKRA